MDGLPGRAVTSLAFGLAALCFLLPFVTAGCDERTTAQGIDFVTGDEPPVYDEDGNVEEDSELAETVIREGAPTATLAFSFALVGAAVSLLPGAVAAATTLLAGVFGLVALGLFLLGLDLRSEGVFADLRAGFWLATLFAAGATTLAWRRWVSAPAGVPRDTRGPRLVTAGALLVALALIVPHVSADTSGDEGDDRTPLTYLWLYAFGPDARDTGVWGAIGAVGLTFFVALAALSLVRSTAPRYAAAAAAALGLSGLLTAAQSIAWSTAVDGQGVGDGAWIQAAGSALVLVGGIIALRHFGKGPGVAPTLSRLLAAIGGATAVVATLITYDRGGADLGSRALLELELDVDRWFALAPLTLALAVVLSAFLLAREAAAGTLLGLGAGLVFAFLPLLYPAFAGAEDAETTSLGAGAFAGLAAAALVVSAGLLASRRSSILTSHVT